MGRNPPRTISLLGVFHPPHPPEVGDLQIQTPAHGYAKMSPNFPFHDFTYYTNTKLDLIHGPYFWILILN